LRPIKSAIERRIGPGETAVHKYTGADDDYEADVHYADETMQLNGGGAIINLAEAIDYVYLLSLVGVEAWVVKRKR
jgi:hypothetical protein